MKIQKDFLYSCIINSLNIIYPLLTYPYISKKIGAFYLGGIDFSLSYMNFFVMLSSFGIVMYGTREISLNIIEKSKIENTFSILFTINIITTIFFLIIYYLILFINNEFLNFNKSLIFILSLVIILRIFSFEWYFRGIQKLDILTLRTMISKVISIIFIFLFIKEKEDYYKYGYIFVFSDLFISILNIYYLYKYNKKNIIRIKLSKYEILEHLKKMYPFFLIILFTNFYRQIDILVLGFYNGNMEVGYFSTAKKLINIFISFLTAIFYVTISKISILRLENKNEYNEKTLNLLYLFIIPIIFGIYIYSKEIIFILFGEKFYCSSILLKKMCMSIFFITINLFISMQILTGDGKEKIVSRIGILIGIINLILNFYLIPKYKSLGSAYSFILSEVVGTYLNIKYLKSYKKIKIITKDLLKYIGICILISIILIKINLYIDIFIFRIIFGILFFGFMYIFLLFIIKDKNFLYLIK